MPTLSVCCSCRTSFHCTCAQRKCFGALIGRAVHGDVYSVAKSEDRPERVNLWPGRRMLSLGCAPATSGTTAALPMSVMNSRRLIASLEAKDRASYRQKPVHWKGPSMSAFGH
jgi:hypothetical protein